MRWVPIIRQQGIDESRQGAFQLLWGGSSDLLVACEVPEGEVMSKQPLKGLALQTFLWRRSHLAMNVSDEPLDKFIQLVRAWDDPVLEIAVNLRSDAFQILRKGCDRPSINLWLCSPQIAPIGVPLELDGRFNQPFHISSTMQLLCRRCHLCTIGNMAAGGSTTCAIHLPQAIGFAIRRVFLLRHEWDNESRPDGFWHEQVLGAHR